jgi:TctA family transporter
MNIRINPSALRETRWHEYLSRFVLGGLATVATGAIANVFGPETGGLFLAFPAIFCASATLIEKHERERKEKVGLRGTRRGKEAAALDAAGAALGSLGLLAFGAAIWLLAPRSAWLALVVGSAAWFAVSVFLWSIRRWIWTWRCTSEPHH